ncbi:MAG TPA: hypothetical protein VMS92_19020 [Mycobacterium sp.]|nr:hypothetical protein [Mycobacterium sp.]
MAATSALETVGQYLTEARRLLQDQIVPYRYPDADLVDALNVGLMEARRVRADLFLPVFTMPWFDPSGTIDTTKAVPLDPMYRSSFVYYIVGRAQLRDDEGTTDQRAAALLTKFTAQLLTVQS